MLDSMIKQTIVVRADEFAAGLSIEERALAAATILSGAITDPSARGRITKVVARVATSLEDGSVDLFEAITIALTAAGIMARAPSVPTVSQEA